MFASGAHDGGSSIDYLGDNQNEERQNHNRNEHFHERKGRVVTLRSGRVLLFHYRLTAANISIDPATLDRSTSWVLGSMDTDEAGQATVIFAVDVVTVGGDKYLI